MLQGNKKIVLIEELKSLEVKQINLKNNINAIKKETFLKGKIEFELKMEESKTEGMNNPITFNKDIMLDYLNREMERSKEDYKNILEELSNMENNE